MLLIKGFFGRLGFSFLAAIGFLVVSESVVSAAENLSGREIVAQCENKYPGEDQKSQLSITLTDKSGNERKTVYVRLWKDNKGKKDIYDKMVLFAMFPPDAKGTGFLRWTYVPEKEKPAEQWINLPSLGKIRKVSARNLGDSFLGSDLTYGDISYRSIDADEHKFIRIDKGQKGEEYYVVVSTPKEAKPQYSKKISWYSKEPDMNDCVKVRADFFDRKEVFLKRQMLKWQKIDDAWVWDKVFVQNVQTFHKSFFEVTKVKINAGVRDSWFEQRRLERGLK